MSVTISHNRKTIKFGKEDEIVCYKVVKNRAIVLKSLLAGHYRNKSIWLGSLIQMFTCLHSEIFLNENMYPF